MAMKLLAVFFSLSIIISVTAESNFINNIESNCEGRPDDDHWMRLFSKSPWLQKKFESLAENSDSQTLMDLFDDSAKQKSPFPDYPLLNTVGQEQKRSALRNAIARRSHKTLDKHGFDGNDKFIPSISVGALTNLRGFFDNIKSNLETLESKSSPQNEFKYISSTVADEMPIAEAYRSPVVMEEVKPTGTAAFLHAIRTYRPSNRVRALVNMQPEMYRGANFQDPNFLWAGLGK